jgi:hypothetical protein
MWHANTDFNREVDELRGIQSLINVRETILSAPCGGLVGGLFMEWSIWVEYPQMTTRCCWPAIVGIRVRGGRASTSKTGAMMRGQGPRCILGAQKMGILDS